MPANCRQIFSTLFAVERDVSSGHTVDPALSSSSQILCRSAEKCGGFFSLMLSQWVGFAVQKLEGRAKGT